MQTVAGGKYKLGKKLGSGSFGEIYAGTDTTTNEQVAVKIESYCSDPAQLNVESRLYPLLRGGIGIPKMHYYGEESRGRIMVLDLLGPSLEQMFSRCERKFSLKTILMLAEQMLSRIEFMHSKNYIHRDIKPENFLLGLNTWSQVVYLIDYGLAKRFNDPKTKMHISSRVSKALTGTVRYASIHAHLGLELSRRDDMESLAHVLIYFCRGSLPWQGIKVVDKNEKYRLIMQKKMLIPVEKLCEGIPKEFATFLEYTRSLRFNDRPDYKYIHKLFRAVFDREGYRYDFEFDWPRPEPIPQPEPPKNVAPPKKKKGGPSGKTLRRRRQRKRRRLREQEARATGRPYTPTNPARASVKK